MRLLEMSISAGVLILAVALLRKGRLLRLSKRTVMMLWMVVLARLLLPFSLPVRGGIAAPVLFLKQKLFHWLKMEAGFGGNGTFTLAGVMPEAASFGITKGAGENMVIQAVWWIWIAGIAVIGIYFVISFVKEYDLLVQALPLENRSQVQLLEAYRTACRLAGVKQQKGRGQLWMHDRIKSPMVFGIISQRIVYPKNLAGLEQDQMQYVLIHEMIHVRRHDNLWKLLSAAALCIHWFNPLAWLMYLLFSRDVELSCDERVLSLYGSQGREGYAMTLLALAQNQKETTLFCSGFLENPVKERIVAIMKYKKISRIGVLCAAIMLLGASSVFAEDVNAQASEEQEAEAARSDETDASADDGKLAQYIVREIEEPVNDGKLADYKIVSIESGNETVVKSGKVKIKEENAESVWLEIMDAESDGLEMPEGCTEITKKIYYLSDGDQMYKIWTDKESDSK